MDPRDAPPSPTLAELQAMLDESLADVAAGRTVPLDTALAELREGVARMRRRTHKTDDAA